MKKNYLFLVVVGVVLITLMDGFYFIIPIIVMGIFATTIYRIITTSVQKQKEVAQYPLPPTIDNEVYTSEHDLAHAYDHPSDDQFYDPTLIDAFRYVDFSNANKTIMTLTNPRKNKNLDETLMFINEGEQVILERNPSSFAVIGVYDRSKTLLGYIPKVRVSLVNQLMRDQRLLKIQIVKMTKTFLGTIIQVELTYMA